MPPKTKAPPVWNGAEALRPLLRPVADLAPHPRNPRRGNVAEISRSLQRFGQMRAILADADGVILAGNHTYLAACELGWDAVAVVTGDFSTPEEARAFLLADNRIGDLATYDSGELGTLLSELAETGEWDGTGYVIDDLEQFRALENLAAAPPPPILDDSAGPGAVTIRELVLLYTEEQLADVSQNIRALRDVYAMESITDIVTEAVLREALRLNQDGD